MNKLHTIISLFCVALVITTARLSNHVKQLTAENSQLTTNNKTLLQGFQSYKVQDSLNAAAVGELTLDLETYKHYHEEDVKLINDLKRRNYSLQKSVKTTLVTHDTIQTVVHDSIFNTDTLYCMSYSDKFLNFNGCINNNKFSGTISSKVDIHLIESVKYKRFLFFRTNKVKSRQFQCVTENPHTDITNFQVITIKQ